MDVQGNGTGIIPIYRCESEPAQGVGGCPDSIEQFAHLQARHAGGDLGSDSTATAGSGRLVPIVEEFCLVGRTAGQKRANCSSGSCAMIRSVHTAQLQGPE